MECRRLLLTALCLFIVQSRIIAAPARRAPRLSGIYAEQSGDSRLCLTVDGERLPRPEIFEQNDTSLILTFKGVSFPALRWQKPLDTPLVPYLEAEQAGNDTAVRLFCASPLELRDVKSAGRALKLFFGRRRAARSRKDPPGPKAAREETISVKPVTLAAADCSPADLLRMLGALARVNIVVDATVPRDAPMSVSFSETPFQEVFDYILRSQNLEYARVGKTVVVGARGSAGMLLGRLTAKSYFVAYADVEKAAELVRELADLTSPANKVVIDERRKALIIRASAHQHERVRRVLADIDAPGRQITFKARIVEVNEDAGDELEGAVNAVYKWWWGSSQGGTFATGGARYGRGGESEGLPNREAADLPGDIGSGVVNLADTAARMLDARIQALVRKSAARIIASPTVTVMDGEKATVKLVEKLKYVSSRDDARNPTYGDEEVGPKLEVAVRIGRGDVITADLSLETGEVTEWIRGAQGEQIPQLNSRSVETKVRVRDGEPFVVGGLFKETLSRTRQGVPVLSGIPLIGGLFSVRQSKKTRSQVVMILIPSILPVEDIAIPAKVL